MRVRQLREGFWGPGWQSRLWGTSLRWTCPCSPAWPSSSLSWDKVMMMQQKWKCYEENRKHKMQAWSLKNCKKISPLPVFGSSVHISFTPSSTMLQCLSSLGVLCRVLPLDSWIKFKFPISSVHTYQKPWLVPTASCYSCSWWEPGCCSWQSLWGPWEVQLRTPPAPSPPSPQESCLPCWPSWWVILSLKSVTCRVLEERIIMWPDINV